MLATMLKNRTFLLSLLIIAGCSTAQRPAVDELGTEQLGRWSVVHRGPDLEAAVGFSQVERSLGDEWLVIAVEFATPSRSGSIDINRSDIFIITPDGHRLALVNQNEFRENYGSFRVRLERGMAILPILGRYETATMPCDRWFLEGPFGSFAVDEINVNTFQVCSGPLVFHVPGGVQPGRWRLIVELEESRADIPFEIEPPR
jgi:hypothetical protein